MAQTSKEQPLFLTVFSGSFCSAELLILFSHPFLLPSFWAGDMYVDTLVPYSYWILSLFTFLYHLTGSAKMITNYTDLIRAAFFFNCCLGVQLLACLENSPAKITFI